MSKYDTGSSIATIGLVGIAGYLVYRMFTATSTATATTPGPPPATGVTSFRELLVSQYS